MNKMQDRWSNLSMDQKSELMDMFLGSGITSLDAMRRAYNEYSDGGSIHIAPSKKGTFTAAATKHGMGVQEFASKVLAHPENYSPAMRKKANFARNSSKWHGLGGNLYDGTSQPTQQMQVGKDYWSQLANGPTWLDTFVTPINGGQLSEVVVKPTNDESWLFSLGRYAHNSRKPLADSHTRRVVANYLSRFDNESAKDYNARISRLADTLDIRGTQFIKNNVESGKLKNRAHYDNKSNTAYIDDMQDIFAEVAHPWQDALGNNNMNDEFKMGNYDPDIDSRGGTRYAYPDTFEGETHGFFQPAITEWVETGKIGRSLPLLSKDLSNEKIVPKDNKEVLDSAASWNRQATDKRLLANPHQLPLTKRIQYSIWDYPLLNKKKALGGHIYDGVTEPTQQMNNSYSYTKPLSNVYVDSEGNVLDPDVPSARGTIQLPEVSVVQRRQMPSANSLNPYNVSNALGQTLRDRMYKTVPPTGYTLSRLRDFISGENRGLYEDVNTEAMYGMYTGQDSIIGSINKFKDWRLAPGRKIYEDEARSLRNPSLASDDRDSGYRKVAVKDLVRPSSIEEGAYEFIYPEYSEIPDSGIDKRQHSHNHSLGTYTLIPGEDKEGKYVDYYDVWDINPFRGVSANDDDFFSSGSKLGLDRFEDIVPWGLPTKVHGRRRKEIPKGFPTSDYF